MSGTTRCPYCTTRFKITEAQMEAHSGMVRCGYCRQTFDARPSFVSTLPNPQLELPIMNSPVETNSPALPVLQPMTLAEQVAIVDDVEEKRPQANRWPWAVAMFLLFTLLFAQTAYFFRVDLAARFPILKPALISYCRLLKCDVPLPQYADMIDIVSSELETIPGNDNRIYVSALLRNRASYTQEFPSLGLTLSDSRANLLARRIFQPAEYLSPAENRIAGLKPNRELDIKLYLDTTDLKPMGYRLVLFYPNHENAGNR